MLTNENTFEKKYDKVSMDIIYNLLKIDKYEKHPLINLNCSTINLIVKKNNIVFEELLNLLNQNGEKVTNESLDGFYNACINYCIQQLRKGSNMYKSILDIYKIMHQVNLNGQKKLLINIKITLGNQ